MRVYISFAFFVVFSKKETLNESDFYQFSPIPCPPLIKVSIEPGELCTNSSCFESRRASETRRRVTSVSREREKRKKEKIENER